MSESKVNGLTKEEVLHFGREGYAGPFTLCSPEEMAVIRERVEREVLSTQSPHQVHQYKDRFLDTRVTYDLCSHPAIRATIASVSGPDLLLFASTFFVKEPGFPPFPYHCDGPYWPLVPLVGVTAWIAIDDATHENGCVSLLPGSHRKLVPHQSFGHTPWSTLKRKMGIKELRGRRAKPRHLNGFEPVHMTIKAGQFFVFAEQTVHMAGANRTEHRRTGLAVRVTVPFVRIRHDEIFPGHQAVMINGEDRFGWNRTTSPPPE